MSLYRKLVRLDMRPSDGYLNSVGQVMPAFHILSSGRLKNSIGLSAHPNSSTRGQTPQKLVNLLLENKADINAVDGE
jgi:hypothetical protein